MKYCELCGKRKDKVNSYDACEVCTDTYGIDFVKMKWQERMAQSDGSSLSDIDDTSYLEVI